MNTGDLKLLHEVTDLLVGWKLHKEGEKVHTEQNYMVEAKSEGKGRQSYRGGGAHAIQAKRRMAEEVASSSSLKLLLLNLHTFCSLTTSCFGSFPFTSLSCLFLFKDSCLVNLVSSTLDTIFIPPFRKQVSLQA
ncbi:hypothetical protein MUK42_28778 [Musa troglodytarum]|uniref:Uncharacterized protein n=1 Tax=Musa troglodytarum TaxID=320322 RepID=A0A9E7GJ63_9LILI|nr:hypothetical protein MUK42_28778 [Musa troglodytarum]